MLGKDLGDQKNLVPYPDHCLAEERVGIAVHFGGVDMGHAEFNAAPQSSDRGRPIRLVEVPCALAYGRHFTRGWPEHTLLHGNLALVRFSVFLVTCWSATRQHVDRAAAAV